LGLLYPAVEELDPIYIYARFLLGPDLNLSSYVVNIEEESEVYGISFSLEQLILSKLILNILFYVVYTIVVSIMDVTILLNRPLITRTLTKKSQSQKRFNERKYQYLKYKKKNHSGPDTYKNYQLSIWCQI
jgi:hypothetical protein